MSTIPRILHTDANVKVVCSPGLSVDLTRTNLLCDAEVHLPGDVNSLEIWGPPS
jgi:hypothetical protein